MSLRSSLSPQIHRGGRRISCFLSFRSFPSCHSGIGRRRERTCDSTAVSGTKKNFELSIMAEAIFPDEWWNLPLEDYDEARITLRALASRDLEPGTKDVSFLQFGERTATRALDKGSFFPCSKPDSLTRVCLNFTIRSER